MRYAHLISVLVCIGCTAARSSSRTSPTESEEIDFIVSALSREYRSYFASDSSLLVYEWFTSDILGSNIHPLTELKSDLASDSLPEDLIQDFIAKGETRQAVWSGLTSRLHLIVITQAEMDSIYSKVGANFLREWEVLRAKYPTSRGVVRTMSRVGFNRERNMALWYVGNRSAGGNLMVFQKEGSDWVGSPTRVRWIR